MATALCDTIVNSDFNAITVDFIQPTSLSTSESFSFSLNNSNDSILILVDATLANPGNYNINFDKGGYPSAKTPAQITVPDGLFKIIAIESGKIEKKNSTAAFTVTASNGPLSASGIRFAVIKRRFVTNN